MKLPQKVCVVLQTSIHVQMSIARLEITSGEQHFFLHGECCILELPVEHEGKEGAVLGGLGGNLAEFHHCGSLRRREEGKSSMFVARRVGRKQMQGILTHTGS